MTFLLNSQAQGVSGEEEQSTQTPWRGAQCSCIGLRPALTMVMAYGSLRHLGENTSLHKTSLQLNRFWYLDLPFQNIRVIPCFVLLFFSWNPPVWSFILVAEDSSWCKDYSALLWRLMPFLRLDPFRLPS